MTGHGHRGLGVAVLRQYRWLSLALVLLVYGWVLFGYASYSDKGHGIHDLVRVLVAAVELAAVGVVCAALRRIGRAVGAQPWWDALAAGLVAALVAVYVSQSHSLMLSNAFISVMALQNASFITYVLNGQLLVLAVLGLVGWAGFCAGLVASRTLPPVGAERWPLPAFCAVLALALGLWGWLLALQQKKTSLELDFREAPLASLVTTVHAKQLVHARLLEQSTRKFDELSCVSRHGEPVDAEYPFQKEKLYHLVANTPPVHAQRKNVIVVFAEGVSARLVGAYNHDAWPGLTPNIDRLASLSMRVDDYYNHTAATFRGLVGQLSSGLSLEGSHGDKGWLSAGGGEVLGKIKRQTVPRILREQGYESVFFSPERRVNPFNRMLDSLGFDQVLTEEAIGDGLLQGRYDERLGTLAMNDGSLFRGLVQFLKNRHAAGEERRFLAGLYNIGTHAFIRVNDEDKKYGDGSNNELNKIHVLDAALGEFLDYFLASDFAKNTILVFTTDHATYWGEEDYRKLFPSGLKPYFIDRVPLLVFDPSGGLPPSLQAGGRTSLDLAPTLLHLLGMSHARNSFLGNSLLAPAAHAAGFAAIANEYFLTHAEGVFGESEIPQASRPWFDCMKDMARYYYSLEAANRLSQ